MKNKKLKLIKELKELVDTQKDFLDRVDPPEVKDLILRNDYSMAQNEIIQTLIERIFKDHEMRELMFLIREG